MKLGDYLEIQQKVSDLQNRITENEEQIKRFNAIIDYSITEFGQISENADQLLKNYNAFIETQNQPELQSIESIIISLPKELDKQIDSFTTVAIMTHSRYKLSNEEVLDFLQEKITKTDLLKPFLKRIRVFEDERKKACEENDRAHQEIEELTNKNMEFIQDKNNKSNIDQLLNLYHRAQKALFELKGPREILFHVGQGQTIKINHIDHVIDGLRNFDLTHCNEMENFIIDLENRIHHVNQVYDAQSEIASRGLTKIDLQQVLQEAFSLCIDRDKGFSEFRNSLENIKVNMDEINQVTRGKQNIINMLQNYIDKIEDNKIDDQVNFKHNFFFFSEKRAHNREVNYELAKKLLKDLTMTNKAIGQIFSSDRVVQERNGIIRAMSRGNPWIDGIHSKDLNDAIKYALSVAGTEEIEEQAVAASSSSMGFIDKK